MVFYYSIRGGPCRNANSRILLDGQKDIICYVGRDKHENEFLIKYGWPGDIWFHVEGLSSAHVYFRIKNLHNSTRIPLDGIPIDDLPVDTVYDMMQICKNNSIQGGKLASCKMVYTPHSNLKKTFEMDSGTVTYHDTKLCRYGRCDKDRPRIKQLEKTKSEDINIDFYDEFQQHQRSMIQRKKQGRNQGGMNNTWDAMYDPMLDDLKTMKHKSKRQGDVLSGIDAALEGLDFAKATVDQIQHCESQDHNGRAINEASTDPLWMQEDKRRRMESNQDLIFLCERGYAPDRVKRTLQEHQRDKLGALKALFVSAGKSSSIPAGSAGSAAGDIDQEELQSARREEKEVLQAIFGEDDPNVQFQEGDEDANLDSVYPITSYEPPDRYELPPPLLMEVYASNTNYPLHGAPVLAIKGGGLSEALLNRLTQLLAVEAMTRAEEEAGDPQIFNLLQFVGEQVQPLVENEGIELKKKAGEERRARRAKAAAAENAKKEGPSSKTVFKNETERRAFALKVIGQDLTTLGGEGRSKVSDNKEKEQYDTSGVSDMTLLEELFN